MLAAMSPILWQASTTGKAITRPARRRTVLLGALAVAAAFAFATSAIAAGPTINVGTPFESGPPAVAVDNAGDAVLAWADTKDLAGAKDFVQYCVLPVGATACSRSINLIPADGGEHIDNVQVLNEGSTLVVLADVYGTKSTEYEPEQEWQSTDGGATFSLVNGGKSVAEGDIAGDTNPLSAVTLPGTGVLGYGWDSAVSAPTFSAFPLISPPECSRAACSAGFATLEPNTNPEQIPNLEGHFASQLGAKAGVLGVFFTDFTNGPFGCSGAQTVPFGTAFVYGSGPQSSTNNYNISPGQTNSAWKLAATQGDCNVEYSAVAGGPSGFGVFEDNELTGQTVYHRFDEIHQNFDTPFATILNEGELDPAVSQDGAGGIYATFLAGGGGGPIKLAYSGDGGNTWTSNTLNPNSDTAAGNVNSSVSAAGQGWATWTDNGSVYAQPFQASDAVAAVSTPPPTPTTISTVQTSGTTSGANITVPDGTVGETDQATISGANAATATGTVSYQLYSNPTCTASSKVFAGSTTAVTAGKAGASTPVTAALAAGSYYWQATYSGDTHNNSSVSTCGSEVLSISNAPKAGESATSTSTTITITVTCSSTPCTVTITITIPTATAARKSKKKPKPITLATGTFTLHKGGAQKLTLRLTKKGRNVLGAHHGHLTASLLLAEKIDGHTIQSTKTIKIKPAAKKHKK